MFDSYGGVQYDDKSASVHYMIIEAYHHWKISNILSTSLPMEIYNIQKRLVTI